MTRKQLIDFTVKKLTGGNIVDFEVSADAIDDTVTDVLEVLTPWYMERLAVQQVEVTYTYDPTVTSSNPRTLNGYFDKSLLNHPVNFVDTILPLRSNYKGDYVLDEISDLLGLPAGLFSSNATREYAVWIQTRDMIRKSMGLKFKWKEIGEQVYLYKVPSESSNQVSVFYYPAPEDVDDVTYGPAVSWMKKRFEAELKKMWSLVILKSSEAAYLRDFANIIRGEAISTIEKSDEELKSLHFKYVSFQRS